MWRTDPDAEFMKWKWVIAVSLTSLVVASAQMSPSSLMPMMATNPKPQTVTFRQAVDRTIAKEHQLVALMANMSPLVETYTQILRPDPQLGMLPVKDKYFLGKLASEHDTKSTSFLSQPGFLGRVRGMRFNAQGFTRTIFPDPDGFDRMHYEFRYAGREVLGKVWCLRMDVLPKSGSGQGRFLGRIWVEDQDYAIVRFNGTLKNDSKLKSSAHFDSWRLNFFPKVWLPVYVYTQESGSHNVLVKAQTRLWAYDLQHAGDHHEFAEKLADVVVAGGNDSGVELSPVLSERASQYSGEETAIERLQVAGLVAPDGGVDRVLETIVKELMLNNDTEGLYNVRCRVVLTLPLDSFSVGHTIFISRGLLDVVPDEGAMALVLAHELGHILLGHSVLAEGVFSDRMLLPNEQVLSTMRLNRDPTEERAAEKKGLRLLLNSPYRQQLSSAAQLLRELKARSPQLSHLISSHLRGMLGGEDGGMAELETQRGDQAAALPLGSRIRLNPWNNRVELIESEVPSTVLVGERIPLGITPFFPSLSRSSLADTAGVP
jgi:peptidase M48-like protein